MASTHLTARNDRIVQWFVSRGNASYQDRLDELGAQYDEIRGEAGRYWHQCDSTLRQLDSILQEQKDIVQRAHDRYEDWASD